LLDNISSLTELLTIGTFYSTAPTVAKLSKVWKQSGYGHTQRPAAWLWQVDFARAFQPIYPPLLVRTRLFVPVLLYTFVVCEI